MNVDGTEVKYIPGYGKSYAISSDGAVWSFLSSKWLKQFKCGSKKNQYLCVELKSRNQRVHRLVALTYLGSGNGLKEVNHKDGDKLNNNLDNLEWCTRQHNVDHAQDNGLNWYLSGEDHPRTKLSTLAVMCMLKDRSNGLKLAELAEKYDCSISNVSYICRGETRIYG